MEKNIKFEVLVDKHLNVKEVWFGDRKMRWIEDIKILCTPERTFISFEVASLGVEFKFWEDEYGTD